MAACLEARDLPENWHFLRNLQGRNEGMALSQRMKIKAQSNQAYSKRFCTAVPFDPGNGTRKGKGCRKQGQDNSKKARAPQSPGSPPDVHFSLLGRGPALFLRVPMTLGTSLP